MDGLHEGFIDINGEPDNRTETDKGSHPEKGQAARQSAVASDAGSEREYTRANRFSDRAFINLIYGFRRV